MCNRVEQCGFMKGRRFMDQVFAVRQVYEKLSSKRDSCKLWVCGFLKGSFNIHVSFKQKLYRSVNVIVQYRVIGFNSDREMHNTKK